MKARATCALLMFVLGGLLSAQSQPSELTDRTFHLGTFHTPQDLQEMATVLRTVADITTLSVDSSGPSISITADAEHLAVSEWLLRNLDHQMYAGASKSTQSIQHTMPTTAKDGGEFVRIFYLANNPTPTQSREFMTALRVAGTVDKIFNYSALKALVARGSNEKLQSVERTLSQLGATAPPTAR